MKDGNNGKITCPHENRMKKRDTWSYLLHSVRIILELKWFVLSSKMHYGKALINKYSIY